LIFIKNVIFISLGIYRCRNEDIILKIELWIVNILLLIIFIVILTFPYDLRVIFFNLTPSLLIILIIFLII